MPSRSKEDDMLLTDVLTEEQGIALDIHWWVFANQPECAPLKEAIQKAFLLHWARCVTKHLKRNAGDPAVALAGDLEGTG